MKDSRSISVREKILIVSQVTAGEKIQPVARKHRVSRPSVYTWTRRALDNLEKALKPRKRGPKFKRDKVDAKDKMITEQKMKIGKLEDIISEKEKQIKNLKKKMALQKRGISRPLKCPHCGFEKIYKNGTYRIKPERFFEKFEKGEIEIVVQQFICPYCRHPVYTPETKRRIILS